MCFTGQNLASYTQHTERLYIRSVYGHRKEESQKIALTRIERQSFPHHRETSSRSYPIGGDRRLDRATTQTVLFELKVRPSISTTNRQSSGALASVRPVTHPAIDECKSVTPNQRGKERKELSWSPSKCSRPFAGRIQRRDCAKECASALWQGLGTIDNAMATTTVNGFSRLNVKTETGKYDSNIVSFWHDTFKWKARNSIGGQKGEWPAELI